MPTERPSSHRSRARSTARGSPRSKGHWPPAKGLLESSRLTKANRAAWETFLEDVSSASQELDDDRTMYCDIWYRGHPRSSYTLLPSLFRGFDDPNEDETWEHIFSEEQDLYWEFASRARELHGVIDEDWDILFAMQHYGVPTRLLDWTETLGVAVYFALHSFDVAAGAEIEVDGGDPPCVWLLNPYELNTRGLHSGDAELEPCDLFDPKMLGWDGEEKTYYGYSELLLEEGMSWEHPLAVYPRQRTNRMQVQRGWFTIHGDQFRRMEDLGDHELFLRRVEIPFDAVPAAREYLRSAGLELFTLFPDLTNLALHLSRQRADHREEFRNFRSRGSG